MLRKTMATLPTNIMTPTQAVELLKILKSAKKARTFSLDEIEDEVKVQESRDIYQDFCD
jgi:hypothetical protein